MLLRNINTGIEIKINYSYITGEGNIIKIISGDGNIYTADNGYAYFKNGLWLATYVDHKFLQLNIVKESKHNEFNDQLFSLLNERKNNEA